MTLVVLVRHGESEWNAERRVQGQAGTGLSPMGHEQAAITADWLAETYPDAELVASDLQRCIETAAPLVAALGRPARPDPGLRERDFGRWTGKLADELRAEDPDLADRWRAGEDVIGELGGEGTGPFSDRVVATLRAVAAGREVGDVVICVTHGGPIWHGTRALLGLGTSVLGPVANCSVTELRFAPVTAPELPRSTVRLVTWNQVAHLPPPLRTWIVDANAAARAPSR